MKWRFVALAASLCLLAPASVNVVRCEPVIYRDAPTTGLYEFTHSFKQVIAAVGEINRRVRLCGDPSMTPVSSVFAANVEDAVPSGPPR